jgi:dihydrofolate reductase
MIAIVVAQAHNRVIGNKNDLPWYLPADLKHFKEITTGHTVIMGRNTYESILARIHKPLPDRRNIVVSRSAQNSLDGVEVARSLDEALQLSGKDKVYIIGGAQLYRSSLDADCIDVLYITDIDANIEGDTLFPEINTGDWEETATEPHPADEKNPYAFTFRTLTRKR